MHLFIKSTAAAVIRRINYPKTPAARFTRAQSLDAKSRPLLSREDEKDAEQTCALALLHTGLTPATKLAIAATERIQSLCPLFHRSACERASYRAAARTLGLVRWKAMFRAVRSTLRIDRRVREDATDFSTMPEIAVTVENPEMSVERRKRLTRMVRYAHSLLHSALAMDDSRKRRSTFRRHVGTLRAFTAIWSGGFTHHPLCEGDSEGALRKVLQRFREYLEKGEGNATFASLEGVPVGAQVRELRTFALIPENFAVGD